MAADNMQAFFKSQQDSFQAFLNRGDGMGLNEARELLQDHVLSMRAMVTISFSSSVNSTPHQTPPSGVATSPGQRTTPKKPAKAERVTPTRKGMTPGGAARLFTPKARMPLDASPPVKRRASDFTEKRDVNKSWENFETATDLRGNESTPKRQRTGQESTQSIKRSDSTNKRR